MPFSNAGLPACVSPEAQRRPSRVGLLAYQAERSSAASPRMEPMLRDLQIAGSSNAGLPACDRPEAQRRRSRVGLLAYQAERSSAASPRMEPMLRDPQIAGSTNAGLPACDRPEAQRRRSRVGLLAYPAERSSAASPRMEPTLRDPQIAGSSNAGLPSCDRPEPQRRQYGRAALGSVGQEAYVTAGRPVVAASLAAFVLFASVAFAQPTLKVRLKPAVDSSTIEMPLERYVAAVVAAEAGTLESDEALRAIAVAARTYAIHFRGRHRDEGYDLCGTTHCQRVEPGMVTARMTAAADATAGELLWYRGTVALALYSRDCGGRTEEGDAPYLRSHPDPYCKPNPWRWSATPREIADALTRSGLRVPRELASIGVARRTESGRVWEAALIGGGESVRVAAASLRLAIGRTMGFATIRSDWWEAKAAGGRIEFTGRGEGHGVGLCQRGADAMGAAGKTWREILAFYYPGASVGKTAQGFDWTRFTGESVTLLTTQGDADRSVLAIAERAIRTVAARTSWPVPQGIEVRVYPDVESFRNATAEPGWVAAHTRGRRIDLQPAAVLRSCGALESTLLHEIAHTFVESRAAPGLPLWFREGLADYLSGGAGRGEEGGDADIAQRGSEKQARAANRAASARVAALISQQGLPAVLSYVQKGLPPRVSAPASTSKPGR
jgi:stage II sporulation protein D